MKKTPYFYLVLISIFISINGMAQERPWYNKQVWFTNQDSVPLYRSQNLNSNIVSYIKHKGTKIEVHLSLDNKWAEITPTKNRSRGYTPAGNVSYYFSGQRNYEFIVDSITITGSIASQYIDSTLNVSQTFYRGDVIMMTREYKDYYTIQYNSELMDNPEIQYNFFGKIPSNVLKPTTKEPTTYFNTDKKIEIIRQSHVKATKPAKIKHGIVTILMVIAIIISIIIFFYTNFILMKRYLYNKSRSNLNISTEITIISGLCMLVAGYCLWTLVNGFGAVVLVIICCLLFLGSMQLVSFKLEIRCDKCAAYLKDITYEGRTKDGTKWEYDQSHNRVKSERMEGDTLIKTTETVDQWLRHQYQMYALNYKCDLCGHKWKVRRKGELLFSEKETEEEIEEKRFRPRH